MYRFSNTLETYPKVWCSWRNIPNDWKGYAFYFHPQQPTMDSQSEGRVGFLQDFPQIFALAFQNIIFCEREVPSTFSMLFHSAQCKWCNVKLFLNIFHLLEPSLTQKLGEENWIVNDSNIFNGRRYKLFPCHENACDLNTDNAQCSLVNVWSLGKP